MTRLNEVLDIAASLIAERGTPNDGTFPPHNLLARCRAAGFSSDEFRTAVEEGKASGQLTEEPGERLRLS
ncbi:hypothetical protein ALQ24_03963 [Pseudomonas syringae pv. antirrhini]|uniref:hypothetical protein n=1 Tax=Pseudomonas TaxID=286 RepID=UPI000B206272|nr:MULTISPECIES: hypothetical protein [Pseudomonas]RMP37192.1 hypothetical protein ALQ23_200135 [Pseudomonas syringae pv. antirrhini]RMP37287.1 hypothetical protein ALQ24_03963 [Pseudomonas syringae pv. antirrhini]WIN08524.1 hypothetical protein QQF68_06665 [Pseudomonas syringae pv. antirrhini str. 126]